MPVEVASNKIKRIRGTARRRARRAVERGLEVATTGMRARVPVSNLDKSHIIDTVRSEVDERRGIIEGVAEVGDDEHPYPWNIEAGTGVGFDPPDTVDTAPPGGTSTPWVYFIPELGLFFTTEGYQARPFVGPSYEEARPVVERLSQEVLR